jgi:tetratricopeptide (TPR) repeat protein
MNLQARFLRKLGLVATLAAGCLMGSPAAGAASAGNAATPQVRTDPAKNCPSRTEMDAALGEASDLMRQAKLQDAAALLQPISADGCDARASLLLAATLEAQGDERKAAEVLQRAHSLWPLNNSIAASLARIDLAGGEKEEAARALTHFHPTADTPEQELEMAVVVFLAANQPLSAEKAAEQDYKSFPSAHSLVLLANTLQMQGRYPDVNRILGSKRDAFSNSAEFLVTLAESEFDASLYPAARDDAEHAIGLNPNLYQAHYLLGNTLFKMSDANGALTEYRLAINIAPEQPRTYYQMALVLRSKQDEAGEQQALEQALAADNHYAPAHCELGMILLENHRPADAVSHLLLAIQDNPRLENAYFQLAKAYSALGEKEKAQEIVRRLQAVRDENRPRQGSNSISSATSNESATQ